MSINTQKYKVTVELEVEREVFPDDPDDMFKLAEIETPHIRNEIGLSLDAEVLSVKVVPVMED